MTETVADVLVAGGGPSGLAVAIALAQSGVSVRLVSQTALPPPGDTRTTALFPPALNFLARLGVDVAAHPAGAPLQAIRLVDRTAWALKAPETLFEASELDLPQFGLNIPNADLMAALVQLARQLAGLSIAEDNGLVAVVPGDRQIVGQLANGEACRARIVVGADGRGSLARAGIGGTVRVTPLDQAALALSFAHAGDHHGISTEIHTMAGPLTTVPLPGRSSSLVWVERPKVIERLMALGDPELAAALTGAVGGHLGAVTSLGPRRWFPLQELVADPVAGNRIALVGEAAHVMPPIGAQGLNLGFRDAAILAGCIVDDLQRGGDPGAAAALAAYVRARQLDIALRHAAVHWLNASLASASLPLQLLRGAGLHALNAVTPLRRQMMRQGLGIAGELPGWMQPLAASP